MLALLIIILIVVFDQLTKYWAVHYLKDMGDIPIIKNVLHFTYAENNGAAFSILQNQRWLFISVTIIAIIIMIYFIYFKKIKNVAVVIAFSFIIGGGLGNLINRLGISFSSDITNSNVVDFLNFAFVRFAIFNVADSFICIGAVFFAIIFFFKEDALKGEKDYEIRSIVSKE